MADFSKDFNLDAGLFTTTKLTLAGSGSGTALQAILSNSAFPDGDLQAGSISFTADTGQVSLSAASGVSGSFDLSASAQAGAGVYGKAADALAALRLADAPSFTFTEAAGDRWLLLDCGFCGSDSGSGTAPIGLLGSATFGASASGDSTFAVLHQFSAMQGAADALQDTVSSWRLPRHVGMGTDGQVNLKPGTWVLAEADGSLMLTVAAQLGWNMTYAKDLTVLGVTHNLSAKIDASLKVNLGFNVAGSYVVAVGREKADAVVRVQLWKRKNNGLNFGLNLAAGIQGGDPQLPADFTDLIQAMFGQHGLQVLQDLRVWTDPTKTIGQKLAGLTDQTIKKLLATSGIDPEAEFDKAKAVVTGLITKWTDLPAAVGSMVWKYLGEATTPAIAAEFMAILGDLSDPAKAESALNTVLENATFGDTPQGEFLAAVADNGLLGLFNDVPEVSKVAGQVLALLNGGPVKQLQDFIVQKLDLMPILNEVQGANFSDIDQWLQNRLAKFLDKDVLAPADLKDIQTALKFLKTVDGQVSQYYVKALQALTKRYSIEFAATYAATTSDTALLDVNFDLAQAGASALLKEVMVQGKLDRLLTEQVAGVTLNMATLTHEIKRTATVDLHMPFFDFTKTTVNDAMTSVMAEDNGGRVLLYQIQQGDDTTTVKNRMMSQLSVLASLQVTAGQVPQLSSGGSIAYEMLQVKAGMGPVDLTGRTKPFVSDYFGNQFPQPDQSLQSFYNGLNGALSKATGSAVGDPIKVLGDVALSMQLALPASALTGWLAPRSADQLKKDQMKLSMTLQRAWKRMLPALYFSDLSHYASDGGAAAMLVWASLPVSLTIDQNNLYWDFEDAQLLSQVVNGQATADSLMAQLTGIETMLREAGSTNAGYFSPQQVTAFTQQIKGETGSLLLRSLLSVEQSLIEGVANALKQGAGFSSAASTTPGEAIAMLASFTSALTSTFNSKVDTIYSGVSGRVVGPMLFLEVSAALGAAPVKPAAMMSIYALKKGHGFDLGTFVDGSMPGAGDLALTQTLVSLG